MVIIYIHRYHINFVMYLMVVFLAAVLCAPVAYDPSLETNLNQHESGKKEKTSFITKKENVAFPIMQERSKNLNVIKGEFVQNHLSQAPLGDSLVKENIRIHQEQKRHDRNFFQQTVKGKFRNGLELAKHIGTNGTFGKDKDNILKSVYQSNARTYIERKKIPVQSDSGISETQIRNTTNATGHEMNDRNPHGYQPKEKRKSNSLFEFRRETVPEFDVYMDTGIFKQFAEQKLNLKAMYEHQGGVCTLIKGYRKSPVYVISECPLLYFYSSIRYLCEYVSPESRTLHNENVIEITNTPVQDMFGFVYRNLYCAQCHEATDIQFWSTSLVCDDLQPLKVSDGIYDVTFMAEFSDKNQGCRRELTPIITHGIHECPISEVTSIMRHGHQTRMGDNSKSDHSPFPLSFTLFMNFGFDGKTHILFSTSPTDQLGSAICNANEMYDPVNDKCRVISCNDGYQLVDGSCQKTETYEYDPSSQDIDLSLADEPLQVELTLKNLSIGMLYVLSLQGIDKLVADAITNQVHISSDRIQNLTITFLNNTDIVNGSLQNEIEIHRFTTPKPSNVVSKSTVNQQTVEKAIDNVSETKTETLVRNQTGDDTAFDEHIETTSDLNDVNLEIAADDSGNSTQLNNVNDTYTSTKDIVTGKGHIDQSNVSKTPSNDDELWLLQAQQDYNVRIAFVLIEAHRNKTVVEKSTKGVVATMNDLIRNNSFMFVLNGTAFQIHSLENAPNPTSLEYFCTKGFKKDYYDQSSFTYTTFYNKNTNRSSTMVYVNETDKVYLPGEYDLTFSFDGIMDNLSRTQMDSFVIVCDTPKIQNELCPRIVLSQNEYQIYENFSIDFANQTYNLSEYEFIKAHDESIRICAPDWSNAQLMYDKGKWGLACGEDMIKLVVAEGYLTFILGLISILSMLTVLITYGLFEKLRNLPGVNTMNLTLSLFLGELVFILSGWIQPHVAWMCSAVGVLLHYLFLASFFWMNVMSFDVYRTFAKKCILRRIREKKKYVPRYALYAWGSPLLIVSVCAFIDFSNVFDELEIGYGGSVSESFSAETVNQQTSTNESESSPDKNVYTIGCWIQKPVASMIAFGGPMMIVLLSNAVMFTRTIICIRASTKSTRSSVRRASLNQLTGRDDVMLYIRMSTVMGFTWVFGLASSVVSAFAGIPTKTSCYVLHLLGILFIVLNCSQGIFIFFAFVCNRRVFALYRGWLHKMKESRKRPLSASSSRGTIYSVYSTSQVTISNSE